MFEVFYMFIDTHCHLSKEDYDDIDLVIKENRENGIGYIENFSDSVLFIKDSEVTYDKNIKV